MRRPSGDQVGASFVRISSAPPAAFGSANVAASPIKSRRRRRIGRDVSGYGGRAAMGLLGFLLLVALAGLIIGALARLAVPGPDPMPIWATIALGVVGAFVGGVIGRLLGLGGAGLLLSLVGAILVLVAYRK